MHSPGDCRHHTSEPLYQSGDAHQFEGVNVDDWKILQHVIASHPGKRDHKQRSGGGSGTTWAGSQEFEVKLIPQNGMADAPILICKIGIHGLQLLEKETRGQLLIFPLETITSWAVQQNYVFIFWASHASTAELKQVRLQSCQHAASAISEVLTAACIAALHARGTPGTHSPLAAHTRANLVMTKSQAANQMNLSELVTLMGASVDTQSNSAAQGQNISPANAAINPALLKLLSHSHAMTPREITGSRLEDTTRDPSRSACDHAKGSGTSLKKGGITPRMLRICRQQQQEAWTSKSSKTATALQTTPLSCTEMKQLSKNSQTETLPGNTGSLSSKEGGHEGKADSQNDTQNNTKGGSTLEAFMSPVAGEDIRDNSSPDGGDDSLHSLPNTGAVTLLNSVPNDKFDLDSLACLDSLPFFSDPPLLNTQLPEQQKALPAEPRSNGQSRGGSTDLEIGGLDRNNLDRVFTSQPAHLELQGPEPRAVPTDYGRDLPMPEPDPAELAGDDSASRDECLWQQLEKEPSQQRQEQREQQQQQQDAGHWGAPKSVWHEDLELLPLDAPIADLPFSEPSPERRWRGSGAGANYHRSLSVSNFDSYPSSPGTVRTSSPGSPFSYGSSPSMSPKAIAIADTNFQGRLSYPPSIGSNGSVSPVARHKRSSSESPRNRDRDSPNGENSPSRKRAWANGELHSMCKMLSPADRKGGDSRQEGRGSSREAALGGSQGALGKLPDGPPTEGQLATHRESARQLAPRKPRQKRGTATDPHAVAARMRRDKISQRMHTLYNMVPNANRSDTATMLEEAINYVRELQEQVQTLKQEPRRQSKACSDSWDGQGSDLNPDLDFSNLADNDCDIPSTAHGNNCTDLSALAIN